jgi:hypothetical protein
VSLKKTTLIEKIYPFAQTGIHGKSETFKITTSRHTLKVDAAVIAVK